MAALELIIAYYRLYYGPLLGYRTRMGLAELYY